MKLLVFGSLNIDHTYHLNHIVKEKETIACQTYNISAGGKGLNQAIALAKTGEHVYLAGCLGNDAKMLEDTLNKFNVDISFIKRVDCPNGHAVIQIDDSSENAIFIYGGSNELVDEEYIDKVLSHFRKGDYLILQNEITKQDYLIRRAFKKGMKIFLNPSPCDEKITSLPLNMVDYFFINEIEGQKLTGQTEPSAILDVMLQKYPQSHIVLTLGEKGSCYKDKGNYFYEPAHQVKAIDTVGAGDTYMGYFIFGLKNNLSPLKCIILATTAASITVQRKGAAEAIPTLDELKQ